MARTDATLMGELRARIARLQREESLSGARPALSLGLSVLDAALPWRGLPTGALHEVSGAGPETEHATAATLLVAGVLARVTGPVVWVLARRDVFPPGLARAGFDPARILFVEAGSAVLAAMEEGLRHRGLAAVVGEIDGRLGLTASRRLQLAAEASGVLAFALRRSRRFDDPALAAPSAALTRWRVSCLPSDPPLPHAPETPGLGRARWRLELVRCRGGEAASWIVEGGDAPGGLRLVADMADRPAAPASDRRHAAG